MTPFFKLALGLILIPPALCVGWLMWVSFAFLSDAPARCAPTVFAASVR